MGEAEHKPNHSTLYKFCEISFWPTKKGKHGKVTSEIFIAASSLPLAIQPSGLYTLSSLF